MEVDIVQLASLAMTYKCCSISIFIIQHHVLMLLHIIGDQGTGQETTCPDWFGGNGVC